MRPQLLDAGRFAACEIDARLSPFFPLVRTDRGLAVTPREFARRLALGEARYVEHRGEVVDPSYHAARFDAHMARVRPEATPALAA